MKEKSGVRYGPKIAFWISFFCVVFVGIAFTTDAFGYKFSATNFDTMFVINKTKLVPAKAASNIGLLYQNVSSINKSVKTKPRQVNLSPNTAISALNGSMAENKRSRKLKTHIAFLKVHKAGSTTMQNLFFRFGLRRHLNILLPKSGNYLNPGTPRMPLKQGQHYDIFACHTVYSEKWFDSLLPADSVKIAIVREPVSRMISSAYYYRDVWSVPYLKKVPPANFIHNLVNFPGKYDTSFFSRTRNSMGKDFGFPKDMKIGNKETIKKYLADLNEQFLLVLVMERFDESLVLMKRVLDWSFIDILYLKTNSHEHRHVLLNKTETAKFRKTSFLDFEIYEYFLKVFEKKIEDAAENFVDEVSFYKVVLKKVNEFCHKKNKGKNATLTIESSNWDNEFKVLNTDCELMQTKELPFIGKLRKHIQA